MASASLLFAISNLRSVHNQAQQIGSQFDLRLAMAKSNAVLMIVGDYVEDYEVMVPFQALQAYGLKVDAVCPGKKAGETIATAIHDFLGHQTYSESKGHNFALTADFKDVDVDSYDALVVPGGRAPEYLSLDVGVLNLVKKFESSHKPIASICHGQLILAAAGILKDKQCTAYPAVKPVVVAAGLCARPSILGECIITVFLLERYYLLEALGGFTKNDAEARIVVCAGGIWKDPSPISACFTDGKLVTGAAWPGHPEFLRQLLQVLGATVQGGDKKVLMLCGDYMEDYEAMVPFQTMQALGYQVDAVCPDKNAGDTCATAVHDFEGAQTYSEKPGHNFALTSTFSEVKAKDYDALVVPGGRAPEYLSLNEQVLDIVREFDNEKKPIASICHGQQILAAAGVLKGKKCTAYPAVKSHVVLSGGQWLQPDPITKCFTDGHLVTGAAWPAHPEFVAQLMVLLGTAVTF